MPARQAAPCLKCGDVIDINEAAFVVDIQLRTVGLGDSHHERLYSSVSICFECADLMAKGMEPPEKSQPLNHVVYKLVREKVTADLGVSLVSWIELRKAQNLPAPTLAELRGMKAFADIRKAFSLPASIEGGEGKPGLVKVG